MASLSRCTIAPRAFATAAAVASSWQGVHRLHLQVKGMRIWTAAAAATTTRRFVIVKTQSQIAPQQASARHGCNTMRNGYARTISSVQMRNRNRPARIVRDDTRLGIRRKMSTAEQEPDLSLVDARFAPPTFDKSSAVVYSNIITVEEEEILMKEILAKMKRRRYEQGHWDNVILKYKEIELDPSFLSDISLGALERIRQHLLARHFQGKHPSSVTFLNCHAIDLHADGQLMAHVDSIRYSGDLVAGLSLRSASIMRFKPSTTPDLDNDTTASSDDQYHVDLYLPQRSLYVMTGSLRYDFTHELLPSGASFTYQLPQQQQDEGGNQTAQADRTIVVKRDHRLSIIFRDSK